MKILLTLALVLVNFAAIAKPATDELAVRQEILIRTAVLWEKQDFKELEKMSVEYRTTKATTPSGIWKLSVFYTALQAQASTSFESEGAWNNLEEMAKTWISAFPSSPTAHLQYVHKILNHAYQQKTQAGMNARIDSTAAYLEKHKKVIAADPRWYELMLHIATIRKWPPERHRKIFMEAIALEPQFWQTYFLASGYYSPDNGGDAKAMESFISSAADRMGGPAGDALYTRMYWWARDNYFGQQLTWTTINCARALRGVDMLLKTNDEPWNVNSLVDFTWYCDDKKRTKALLMKIGDTPLMDAWGNSAKRFAKTQAWAMK